VKSTGNTGSKIVKKPLHHQNGMVDLNLILLYHYIIYTGMAA
jgi:hypothetical protein